MSDEFFPKGQDPNEDPSIVRFDDIDPTQAEADSEAFVGEDFPINIVALPTDGPAMTIQEGVIFLDKERLEAEMGSVTDWLVRGIESGDESVLAVYLRNLPGSASEEEIAVLKKQLETAFEAKDPSQLKLDELHVNVVSAGIAERNLIREGLRPELLRQPLHFRDKHGKTLSGEDDLDIVFAKNERSKGGEFKIIVGSRQGIDSIVIPKSLPSDKFKPDFTKMQKDEMSDVITIPLKPSGDGTHPSAGTIEIHRGSVNIMEDLARQDREEADRQARLERERQEEERYRQQYTPPPPSPSPGRWTGYSG